MNPGQIIGILLMASSALGLVFILGCKKGIRDAREELTRFNTLFPPVPHSNVPLGKWMDN